MQPGDPPWEEAKELSQGLWPMNWHPAQPQAHSRLPLCPMAQGPALTVEAHIVVRQDGRAIPLG